MTTALFIGRFAPAHKGHIESIMKLLSTYDRVVIGLGSCYEHGTKRHPLLAIFREKMLLLSIANNGGDLSRVKIIHIQDYGTFDEWIEDIMLVAKQNNVTHFVTGNKEDILDVLESKNIALPFEFVNPEETSSVPYHATDLRNAIAEGDFAKFSEIASYGTMMLLGNVDGLNGIRQALDNSGRGFFKGRQTVDLVFTIQERVVPESKVPYLKTYVLCGLRDQDKMDYPNYLGLVGDEIFKFESPISACLRALEEKTGIKSNLESNLTEPAIITIHTDDRPVITELKFLQLYNDEKLAGTRGGSSQTFHINLYCSPKVFDEALKNSKFKFMPVYEVLEQGLAYQQKDMLKDAINKLNNYV